MVEKELTKKEQSIHNRLNRIFEEMKGQNLCVFVNDGTFEIYRGNDPPHNYFGAVDNTKSIMSFFGPKYCSFDGGATL